MTDVRIFEDMDEATAQEYLERYVASLPELRARFARRLKATGGPDVDLSVEALRAVDPWYAQQIADPAPDGLDSTPLWWDQDRSAGRAREGQLRLVDEVGAHLAAVMQQAVPTSEWVVRKQPGGPRTHGHHTTVLRMGASMVRPWYTPYKHVASLMRNKPLRAGILHDEVAYFVENGRSAAD